MEKVNRGSDLLGKQPAELENQILDQLGQEDDDNVANMEHGQSAIALEMKENDSSPRKLFLRGVPGKITEQDLLDHFGSFGKVVYCKLGKHNRSKPRSYNAKGFGFLEMSTDDEMEAVLSAEHVVLGRVLSVTRSKPTNVAKEPVRLIVTGLDKEHTTQDSLGEHFSQFGKIQKCSLKLEAVNDRLVSMGNGVVVMETDEDTKKVLDARIDGCQLIDGANAEIKPLEIDSEIRLKKFKIYVGNLDPDLTTKEDIKEHFDQYGSVLDVSYNRKTKESLHVTCAHCFIKMSTEEEYSNVMKVHQGEHGHMIHGRVLDVRTFQHFQEENIQLRRIFVGGLHKEKATEEELSEYFGAFGTVELCEIQRRDEGISKGYALVTMATSAQAETVLKHPTPHTIGSRKLDVNRAMPITRFSMVRAHVNKLKVTCLKDGLTEEDLREYFSQNATVKSIAMVPDEDDEKLGFAIIELDSHHDVERFAIMHEHFIKDAQVIANKYKPIDPDKQEKEKAAQSGSKKKGDWSQFGLNWGNFEWWDSSCGPITGSHGRGAPRRGGRSGSGKGGWRGGREGCSYGGEASAGYSGEQGAGYGGNWGAGYGGDWGARYGGDGGAGYGGDWGAGCGGDWGDGYVGDCGAGYGGDWGAGCGGDWGAGYGGDWGNGWGGGEADWGSGYGGNWGDGSGAQWGGGSGGEWGGGNAANNWGGNSYGSNGNNADVARRGRGKSRVKVTGKGQRNQQGKPY